MTTSRATPEHVPITRRFLTERDLASMLNVSVKTIQGWRFRAKGPPWRKFCGAVRYDAGAVEQWAESQPGGGGAQ